MIGEKVSSNVVMAKGNLYVTNEIDRFMCLAVLHFVGFGARTHNSSTLLDPKGSLASRHKTRVLQTDGYRHYDICDICLGLPNDWVQSIH